MRKLNFLWLGLLALVVSSCGSGGGSKADYLPVKMEKDGKWGLVSKDGEVLFSEEFEHEPTLAYNGRFLVKNADGLWEIYTTDEKPEKVGKEYKAAGVFVENVAPVVEKGKPIDFIDRDGNVKFTLKDVEGKPVQWVYNFSDGLAVFATEAGQGAIDPSGDVEVKPEYCSFLTGFSDGKAYAVENKYAEVYSRCGLDSVKVCVIDKKGEKLFEFNGDKYYSVSPFMDGKSVVSQKNEDGDVRFGIIDDKGEWVVKPSSKLHGISGVMEDKFIYYDGDNYGLMDMDGEVLLRAKYDRLAFATKDRLVVGSMKDRECKIIDLEGNEVGKDTYEDITFIPALVEGCGVAKEGKGSYLLIDTDGNPIDSKQSFYEVGYTWGDNKIESDFTDIPALVGALKLTPDGMAGVKFGTKVADVFNAFGESIYPSYSSYGNTSWDFDLSGQKCDYKVKTLFNASIVDRRSSGWWSHDYFMTEATVNGFVASYPLRGRLEGKADEVYKQLQEELKRLGAKETGKTASALQYKLGDKDLLLGKSDSNVVLGFSMAGGSVAASLAADLGMPADTYAAEDTLAVVEEPYIADSVMVD